MSKTYELQQLKYLKSLQKNPKVLNEDIKSKTLKSIINWTAKFLFIKCPHCFTQLVDPIGFKSKDEKNHSRCGNCGYAGYY